MICQGGSALHLRSLQCEDCLGCDQKSVVFEVLSVVFLLSFCLGS